MKQYKKPWQPMGIMLLILSLLAGNLGISNTADAAGKTSLAKKKIVLTTGYKEKIKIKNKKKGRTYQFRVKNKKIATVSKKGVITAKKKGNTSVTVQEKYKKKKKVIGTITVIVRKREPRKNQTPAPVASSSPTVVPSSVPSPSVAPTAIPTYIPTPVPTPKETWVPYEWQDYDLSVRENNAGTYDNDKKCLTLEQTNGVKFPLDSVLERNQVLAVEMTIRVTDVKGFRCVLRDEAGSIASGGYNSSMDQDFVLGETVAISFQIKAVKKAKYLSVEGINDAVIERIEIQKMKIRFTNEITESPLPDPYQPETEQDADTENLVLTKSYSEHEGELRKNPLVTRFFMADPTAIEHEGRLYIYGTADKLEGDEKGRIVSNGYNTAEIQCISSSDLVNWKDEGKIDVKKAAPWATHSWAPSICKKGDDFYLYFANGSGGIGVLKGKSPVGPWEDPLGEALITSSTPNCSSKLVPWLFDPAVLVDDDGTGYLYFGGGTVGDGVNSKSGRVVQLTDDMVHLACEPKQLEPSYLFEDSEVNKINGKYYYSYCTNWKVPSDHDVFGQANIAYYMSDSPMEGFDWTKPAKVFDNPGTVFGTFYNNHHKMIEFKGEYYIIYHTVVLEEKAYGNVPHNNNVAASYRCMNLNKLEIAEDGNLRAKATYDGVDSVADLNPYESVSATVTAWDAGLKTCYSESRDAMVADSIHTGDWFAVNAVAFGEEGASKIKMSLASETDIGKIEIYVDGASVTEGGTKIGEVSLEKTGGNDSYKEITTDLQKKITGTHTLYFVFRGSGYHIADWQFEK